jgi:hypothetical protein
MLGAWVGAHTVNRRAAAEGSYSAAVHRLHAGVGEEGQFVVRRERALPTTQPRPSPEHGCAGLSALPGDRWDTESDLPGPSPPPRSRAPRRLLRGQVSPASTATARSQQRRRLRGHGPRSADVSADSPAARRGEPRTASGQHRTMAAGGARRRRARRAGEWTAEQAEVLRLASTGRLGQCRAASAASSLGRSAAALRVGDGTSAVTSWRRHGPAMRASIRASAPARRRVSQARSC